MRMTEPDKDDIALDAYFAAARSEKSAPGDVLMARILADAAQAQGRPATPAGAPTPASVSTGWRSVLAAIGGWPAMGGMVMATMAGLWIGISPPSALTSFASGLLGETISVQVYADDDPLGLLEG
jgi:hypothetical protein